MYQHVQMKLLSCSSKTRAVEHILKKQNKEFPQKSTSTVLVVFSCFIASSGLEQR